MYTYSKMLVEIKNEEDKDRDETDKVEHAEHSEEGC